MRIEPQAEHLGEEAMIFRATVSMFCAAVVLAFNALVAQAAPFMIVGDDEKVGFDNGKTVVSPPGKDSVLIVDLANPLDPKIVANLPLKNSVVGPPVNLAIDPTDSVAIVADAMNAVRDGDNWKQVPDNKIYVIDLKANPAKLINTIEGDKQPSGPSTGPEDKVPQYPSDPVVTQSGDLWVLGNHRLLCADARGAPSRICSRWRHS
jgi:hypothetical protein